LCRSWHSQRLAHFAVAMPYSATHIDGTGTFSDIGSWLVKFFEWFGNLAMFCGRLVRSAVSPPTNSGNSFINSTNWVQSRFRSWL
jgi:hypothetical protein